MRAKIGWFVVFFVLPSWLGLFRITLRIILFPYLWNVVPAYYIYDFYKRLSTVLIRTKTFNLSDSKVVEDINSFDQRLDLVNGSVLL